VSREAIREAAGVPAKPPSTGLDVLRAVEESLEAASRSLDAARRMLTILRDGNSERPGKRCEGDHRDVRRVGGFGGGEESLVCFACGEPVEAT